MQVLPTGPGASGSPSSQKTVGLKQEWEWLQAAEIRGRKEKRSESIQIPDSCHPALWLAELGHFRLCITKQAPCAQPGTETTLAWLSAGKLISSPATALLENSGLLFSLDFLNYLGNEEAETISLMTCRYEPAISLLGIYPPDKLSKHWKTQPRDVSCSIVYSSNLEVHPRDSVSELQPWTKSGPQPIFVWQWAKNGLYIFKALLKEQGERGEDGAENLWFTKPQILALFRKSLLTCEL